MKQTKSIALLLALVFMSTVPVMAEGGGAVPGSRFVLPANQALALSDNEPERTADTTWVVHTTIVNDTTTVTDSTMIVTNQTELNRAMIDANKKANTALIVGVVVSAATLLWIMAD